MKKKWHQWNWRQFFIRLTGVVSVIAAVFTCIAGFIAQAYAEAVLASLIVFCGAWVVYGIGWILWLCGRWVYTGLLNDDED